MAAAMTIPLRLMAMSVMDKSPVIVSIDAPGATHWVLRTLQRTGNKNHMKCIMARLTGGLLLN